MKKQDNEKWPYGQRINLPSLVFSFFVIIKTVRVSSTVFMLSKKYRYYIDG